MAVQLAKSVGKATHRLCSCTTQVVSKFPKDMIDAIRALVCLASCGNRYQQQWLSQQVPGKPTVWLGKGALREQRIPGVPGPFSSVEGLSQPFALCSEQPRCYLSAATNSSSSSSARKCQPNRLSQQMIKERCESNVSPVFLGRSPRVKA